MHPRTLVVSLGLVGLVFIHGGRASEAPLALGPVDRCNLPEEPPANTYVARENVRYANIAGHGLDLDLYVPRAVKHPPLVVIIHGGSWTFGAREDERVDAKILTSLGYAAATLTYRLANGFDNHFPAAIQDVRCAVRFLKKNSTNFGIDKSRVGTLGFSAGAHLVAMLGTAENVPGLDSPDCKITDQSPSVDSVVSYYGPHDLRSSLRLNPLQILILTNFLGIIPELDPGRAAMASPLTHVSAVTPPFLLVHGVDDDVVPIESSEKMDKALNSVHRPSVFIRVDGGGHSFPLFSNEAGLQRSMCTTIDFLQQTLDNKASITF